MASKRQCAVVESSLDVPTGAECALGEVEPVGGPGRRQGRAHPFRIQLKGVASQFLPAASHGTSVSGEAGIICPVVHQDIGEARNNVAMQMHDEQPQLVLCMVQTGFESATGEKFFPSDHQV